MSPRARFTIASTVGAVIGGLWFVWMLTEGTFDLFAWHPVADFYDAQAHALLDGRLDVPAAVMGIEGFVVDGKTYMYQGPAPAFVRLPIALLTHELDGRLSRVAMLIAFVIAMVASLRILWQVRVRIRGDAPLPIVEAVLVGGWSFVLAGGSTLLFTASRAYVYHESLLWAVAFALLTFDQLVAFGQRPTRGRLGAAGAFATLAMLSRASVGLGAVAALGLLAMVAVVRRVRARRSQRPGPTTRRLLALCAVAAFPVLVYCAINVAKFHTLVSVPWKDQVYSSIVVEREQFLAENGGDFFGLQYVPETVQRYLRPDGFTVSRQFPYIDFESPPPSPVVHGVRFDTIDVSASLTATLPFLWVLAAVGVVALVRRAPDRDALAPLRVPVVGAAVGALAIFPFGYVAQRYLGDWLPLLVLLGSAGVVVVARPLPHHRTARAVVLVLLAVLGVWTTVANSALALLYQRQYSNPPVGESAVEQFVDVRARLAETYGNRADLVVDTGARAPAWAPAGALFIAGDCDGLYLSDGLRIDALRVSSYRPVVRGHRAGGFTLRVRPDRSAVGARVPLLTGGPPDLPFAVWLERTSDDEVVVGYEGPGVERTESRPVRLPAGAEATIDVSADPNVRRVEVAVNGRGVLGTYFNSGGPYRVGASKGDGGLARRFAGDLEVVPPDLGLCRRVQSLARSAG